MTTLATLTSFTAFANAGVEKPKKVLQSVSILGAYRLSSGKLLIDTYNDGNIFGSRVHLKSYLCEQKETGLTLKIDLDVKAFPGNLMEGMNVLTLPPTESCDPSLATQIETQDYQGKPRLIKIEDGSHLKLYRLLGMLAAFEPVQNDEITQKDGSIQFTKVGFNVMERGGCGNGRSIPDYGYRGTAHGAKAACKDRGYKSMVQFTAGCVQEKVYAEQTPDFLVPFNRLRLSRDLVKAIFTGSPSHAKCRTEVLIDVTCK